jgi:type II secretory pathway component PulC
MPGKVIGQIGRVLFKVRTDRGIWKRHVNQLQPRLEQNADDSSPQIIQPEATPVSTNIPDASHQPRYPRRNRRRPDYYDSSKY